MSTISLSIAPDVSPQQLPAWHLFSRWLQRQIGTSINIKEYQSFAEQKAALEAGEIDMLYANPYDAGWLIREKKYIGVAQPEGDVAEVTLVSKKEGAIQSVEDLKSSLKVAAAPNEDLRTLGTILLEPANLTKDDIEFVEASNHILAVKALLSGDADVAMLPTKSLEGLSNVIASQLQVLVATEAKDIETVAHCFVVSPEYAELATSIKEHLRTMHEDPIAKGTLEDIAIKKWHILDSEDEITFMIDLIYTLQI